VVEDIRDGPPEQYWDRLQRMLGADGLLTYRHLGRAVNQAVDVDTMRLRHDMRNPSGGIMAAPLAIAAPETGGWRDWDAVPAPVAYSLHILDDAADIEEVRITRSTVRRGQRMGFSRSVISDAADPGRTIAVTTGIGVTLGQPPPGFRPIDPPPQAPDDADLPSLRVAFGAARDPDGWRLPELGPRHASTSASLHLGPIHVVFEAAAMEAVAARTRTHDIQVEDWGVHFVSPGTVGPFLVRTEALSGRGPRVAARLTLVDEGRDERVVAVGAATFRAP
jgi:hypothetical protein